MRTRGYTTAALRKHLTIHGRTASTWHTLTLRAQELVGIAVIIKESEASWFVPPAIRTLPFSSPIFADLSATNISVTIFYKVVRDGTALRW